MKSELDDITDKKAARDEIMLLDYLIILAKRKNLIILITAIAIVTAIAYSYIKPPQYTGTVKLLPPAVDGPGNVGSLLKLPGFILNNFARANSSITSRDSLTEILHTRPVIDIFISKLQSTEEYKEDYDDEDEMELAMYEFMGRVSIDENKKLTSPIITVTYVDTDPVTAANKANIAVEALNERLQELAITTASQKRLFFEKELIKAKDNLIASEQEMIRFQEETAVLKVENQVGAVLSGIAQLKADISEKEVELMVMRTYSTPENPEYQQLQETLNGLKVQLTKLREKDGSDLDSFVPLSKIPSVSAEYVRKLRNLKFNEKIFELMMSQYESARIDEVKNPSMLQVIEKAEPFRKYRRGTVNRIIKYSAVAFFLSVFAVFILEFVEANSGSKETAERIATLKRHLSSKNS